MSTVDCVIELGTEELPPKALKPLSLSFAELTRKALEDCGLAPSSVRAFATPRRLAMLLHDVPTRQPDRVVEKRGPAVKAAFDAEGKPSKAALGFAKSCGVDLDQLTRKQTDKGDWLYFEKSKAGLDLQQILPELVAAALASLPIPKRMRWGTRSDEFVRPVKWLLIMAGSEAVDAEILGVRAGTVSYGKRLHAPGEITIPQSSDYE